MVIKFLNRIVNVFLFPNKRQKTILTIIISIMIPLVYLFVYFTGGIKCVYSHSMYIPILLMAIVCGFKGGIITALIGGLLLGPFMPIDVITGERQETLNWIYRMIVFFAIGGFAGYFVDMFRKNKMEIVSLLSTHRESKVILFNSLSNTEKNTILQRTVYAFRVLNFQNIVSYLGSNIYFNLWRHIKESLFKEESLKGSLYQVDDRTFIFVSLEANVKEMSSIVQKIMLDSHRVDGVPIYIDVAIGHVTDNSELSKQVNEALVASRHAEENYVTFMTYEKDQEPFNRSFSLLAELRDAIENDDLYLEYQPICDSANCNIMGVEALVRWNHKEYGIIPPVKFIPVAEQTQLINLLTLYITKKIKNDILSDLVQHNQYISINISPKNILNVDLMNQLISDDIFNHEEREHIIFEITEYILIKNPNQVMEVLWNIKNNGYRLALDDFGTGYSSLGYMGKYPLDIIKIDKTLTQRYSNKSIKSIVDKVIELSHSLEYKVVAEGVETQNMVNQLSGTQCDFLQGYYLSRPVGLSVIKEMIANPSVFKEKHSNKVA
jgi:EAL domain-containing protein (putative c-di-GMP-specific phosphodiesterase class I)